MKMLKRVFASLVCFAIAASVLTACGGSSKGITVALGGDVTTLDPAKVDASIDNNILTNAYDGLYRLATDGSVECNLAVDMPEVSKDGKTYTVKFKEGVTWSDGEPLTANDFVYSWKRAAAIGTADAYYSQFITKYIEGAVDGAADPNVDAFAAMADWGVKAIDDTTIEIKLTKRVPYFTSLLTSNVFYPVRESAVGENPLNDQWAKEAGYPVVGAFNFTAIDYANTITLEPNEAYYDAESVSLEGITFKVMSDVDSEVSGFQSGDIDIATAVNAETVFADEELSKCAYTIDPFVCNYYILFNCGNENDESTEGLKALKDADIRKAISMAIDREEVCKVSGYGESAKPLYGFVPSGIPGNGGDFRETTGDETKYDVDAAKKIMESKGYSADKMLTIEYKYNDLQMHKDIAQLVQANLKNIYIDFQLVSTEKSTFFEQRDNGEGEAFRHAMSADYMDPMIYLEMLYGAKTSGNLTDDAKYEAMIDAANAEVDPGKRLDMLGDAEKYLVGEMNYLVPLMSYADPMLVSPKIKGMTSSPEGHYNLTRCTIEE